MQKVDDLVQKALSRRSFLAGAGTVAAAGMIAGCGNSTPAPIATSTVKYTDADILNFALNLEYLEAEFYLRAATGSGLAATDTTGTGTAGAVTGGTKVPGLTAAQQAILNEIAFDEQAHVLFLRKALGSAAVARPAIDLTFFGPLAQVATITTSATAFNPFADFNSFLIGAFIFEDVGVTAYHGAAPLISSAGISAGLLTAAAGILAVEGYHAAYVRTAITGIDIAGGAANLITTANKVATLRASLGGGNETLLKFPTSVSTPSAIVPADVNNAIAFVRTTDQVHHIVYGSATVGASKGGFFPAGTNSIFSVTAS